MNNFKSYETHFFFLINKCLLLFKYINVNYQKEILNEIKLFIHKLQEIFSTADFKSNIEKKNKILEILIHYFEKIIDDKIFPYMDNTHNKYLIISEIDNIALIASEKSSNNYAEKILNDTLSEPKKQEYKNNDYQQNQQQDYKNNTYKQNQQNQQKEMKQSLSKKEYTTNIDKEKEKDINVKLEEIERKLNNKMKVVFSEIENNIKTSFKNYFDHAQYFEYDLDKKFNQKMEFNNQLLEEKIKSIISESNIATDHPSMIRYEIEDKIKVLATIFNENIQKMFENLTDRITNNEEELLRFFDEKINNSNFNKNNFNIIFDKDLNEIKLLYCDDIITSTKINIKGLIGPKGPIGNKGDKGETPIIRKIEFTNDDKLKFIIQESNNIYDVVSDERIPSGPPGPKGDKGEPGKSTLELKWNQENVMLIDEEQNNSVIFLKSLSVGDKSHCLKDNSLSIGGATCYQNNSLAIGNNSKTLDSESIALFGSTIGKKALSYRANNIDENTVQFGMKDNKNNFNINTFNINSKEINLECEYLKIKTNKYENTKFLEFEERLIQIEKKLVDVLRKI